MHSAMMHLFTYFTFYELVSFFFFAKKYTRHSSCDNIRLVFSNSHCAYWVLFRLRVMHVNEYVNQIAAFRVHKQNFQNLDWINSD